MPELRDKQPRNQNVINSDLINTYRLLAEKQCETISHIIC